MFCPIIPLTREEILSQARLVMTPHFPAAAFATGTSALRHGDLQHGSSKGENELQLSLLMGEELQNLLNSCKRDPAWLRISSSMISLLITIINSRSVPHIGILQNVVVIMRQEIMSNIVFGPTVCYLTLL